jgi:hypothetical protein
MNPAGKLGKSQNVPFYRVSDDPDLHEVIRNSCKITISNLILAKDIALLTEGASIPFRRDNERQPGPS